jgi:hypothetical protein
VGNSIRYFDPIDYNGYVIQPFSTRRCGKRDFMILNARLADGGRKQHNGNFYYIGQARTYIDERLNKDK